MRQELFASRASYRGSGSLPVEHALADAGGDECVRRLRKADPRSRARYLDLLIRSSGEQLDDRIGDWVSTLTPAKRERLFQETRAGDG